MEKFEKLRLLMACFAACIAVCIAEIWSKKGEQKTILKKYKRTIK